MDPNEETESAERLKELEKATGVQDNRIQNLLSSAFQLANYYFVFQGVVLAAIYNSSSLTYTDPWIIIVVSLIAAILNLCALFNISYEYIRVMDQHEKTWSNRNNAAASLRSPLTERTGDDWSDRFSQTRRAVILAVCMVLFVASTVVMLGGLWRAHHRLKNLHLPHANPDSGCIKLCDQSSRCMLFCQDIQ